MGSRVSFLRRSRENKEGDDVAKVVHAGAGLARAYATAATTVGPLEAENPGYYLCSWETMKIGELPKRMAPSDELHSGEVYFLLPEFSFQKPFSLSELCILASRAAAALRRFPLRHLSADLTNWTGFLILKFSWLTSDSSLFILSRWLRFISNAIIVNLTRGGRK